MKINYLLDSYTGVIGDFVLPLTNKAAEKDPFTKRFTLDSKIQNKYNDEFYKNQRK